MYVFKLVNCHNFKYFRNSLQANLSYVLVGQFDSCKRSFNHGFRHDLALLVQLDALQRGRQAFMSRVYALTFSFTPKSVS